MEDNGYCGNLQKYEQIVLGALSLNVPYLLSMSKSTRCRLMK